MFEVYSEVRAILSPHVVDAIEGSVMDAMRQHVFSASVEEVIDENEIQYHLCGSLDGILVAKGKLEELIAQLHTRKQQMEHESSEQESTSCTLSEENSSLADEGNTSCEKEGTDKTSCLSDDKERETNASSNGYVSTTTETGSSRILPLRPLAKKLRFLLKERSRRSARLSMQLRTLKKRGRPDPDRLSENLRQMRLCTDNSDSADARQMSSSESKVDSEVPYKHSCSLCSFRTKRISHFRKHMTIHDKVKTLYKCNKCMFTSVRLSHLRRHEISHSSTVHACTKCPYKTDDVKFLTRHTKLKHPPLHDKNSTTVLKCRYCNYQTVKQHYFERHQRLHCTKRNFLHQCDQCGYKTYRKEHFVRHVNDVHRGDRPHLCHRCGKAFKRREALQQHAQVHTDEAVAPHKCGTCGKSFRSQSHLFEHRAVHSETRAFLCEVCGASFKTRSVHRKHVLSIHRNPGSYPCGECTKKFNTMFALKRHQKTHSGKFHGGGMPQTVVEAVPPAVPPSMAPMATVTSVPTGTIVQFSIAPEATAIDVAATLPSDVSELMQQIAPSVLQPTETATLFYLSNNLTQL